MYNPVTESKEIEIVKRLYKLGGHSSEQRARTFLMLLKNGRVSIERLKGGAMAVEHLLDVGTAPSCKLTDISGCPMTQMPSISPYKLGVIGVVDGRGTHCIYGLAVLREVAETYVNLVRELIMVDNNAS